MTTPYSFLCFVSVFILTFLSVGILVVNFFLSSNLNPVPNSDDLIGENNVSEEVPNTTRSITTARILTAFDFQPDQSAFGTLLNLVSNIIGSFLQEEKLPEASGLSLKLLA